ncbi:M61 metallopeptidase family protein [Hamadaea tsunoensis]|uniref:hypothetical protein n=1 Tax=Hamadaea tsunoensis TaxID=53368 RepID=UPI0003F81DCC|nr:hypothetical protein [Hamadaea tsunoensis]
MAHLSVTLTVGAPGVLVTWSLDGVAVPAGGPVGRLPVAVAGAPTLRLADDAVTAVDDLGPLPLVATVAEEDGEAVRRWTAGRAAQGRITLSHPAEPVAAEPGPATPPLELRREAGGLSGAVKCFVILPPGPEELTFDLRWDLPAAGRWTAVTSLGEGGEVAGAGLERLGDTYVMCGDLADRHHRDGEFSVWWLADPGIDVQAFADRLGTTYRIMAEAFGAPAHAYRVFLRGHPHRGANASAHPASFVMALNPAQPLGAASLYETIAHELVHEWLRLDGASEDVTWFVEGAADYYSLVLPWRAGLIGDEEFLRAVNFEAREAYANPRRHLDLRQVQQVFFSDFLAHRLAYARGLFYLADLDGRLRHATGGRQSVDDVVRGVVRARATGERVGVEQWCARVGEFLPAAEQPILDALAFTGAGRPAPDCFGPGFTGEVIDVPVPDVGFDPSTFISREVRGLVPGGPADRAGLREGERLDLPRYPDIVGLDIGEGLEVGVIRDGAPVRITIPMSGGTAPVPRWRTAVAVPGAAPTGGSWPGR